MRATTIAACVIAFAAASLAHASPLEYPPAYRNPQLPVEQRVEDLLRRMTLEEKLNQTRSGDWDAAWQKAARTTGVGEVFDILRPLETRQSAELANRVQRLARQSRLHIPIIIRDEALHGLISNGATSFPQSIALAATWDPAVVGRVADAIGYEARVRGVRRVLSPVINVVRDARWGASRRLTARTPTSAPGWPQPTAAPSRTAAWRRRRSTSWPTSATAAAIATPFTSRSKPCARSTCRRSRLR